MSIKTTTSFPWVKFGKKNKLDETNNKKKIIISSIMPLDGVVYTDKVESPCLTKKLFIFKNVVLNFICNGKYDQILSCKKQLTSLMMKWLNGTWRLISVLRIGNKGQFGQVHIVTKS